MASWGDMAGKGITLFGGLKRENCIQFVENKIVQNLTAVDATITLCLNILYIWDYGNFQAFLFGVIEQISIRVR